MIHEMRIYQMTMSGKEEVLQVFRESVGDLFPRHGFKLLATWVTAIGPHSAVDFIWLLEWQDMGQRERAAKSILADQEFISAAEKLRPHIVDMTVRILNPTDFSPMK